MDVTIKSLHSRGNSLSMKSPFVQEKFGEKNQWIQLGEDNKVKRISAKVEGIQDAAHGGGGVSLLFAATQMGGITRHRRPPLVQGCSRYQSQIIWPDGVNQILQGWPCQDDPLQA